MDKFDYMKCYNNLDYCDNYSYNGSCPEQIDECLGILSKLGLSKDDSKLLINRLMVVAYHVAREAAGDVIDERDREDLYRGYDE